MLESYFSIQKFSNNEKITFALLKTLHHVIDWWETYCEQHVEDESATFGSGPTWVDFIDSLKEQHYRIVNYNDQYTRWTTLRQERDQTVSKFTNTFHTLRTKMGIKDSEWHLVLKYCGALHRYIQTEMEFLDISSLGVAYRNDVKIEQKFKQQKKQEFGSTNSQQLKYGKDGPNSQGKGQSNNG
jgi:hypothetical protein